MTLDELTRIAVSARQDDTGLVVHSMSAAVLAVLAEVRKAVPMAAVRDLMGHSSLAVTSRYAHMAARHLREAVATLPQVGRGGHGAGRKRSGTG